MFSCEFCKISKNTFFYTTRPVAVSEFFKVIKQQKISQRSLLFILFINSEHGVSTLIPDPSMKCSMPCGNGTRPLIESCLPPMGTGFPCCLKYTNETTSCNEQDCPMFGTDRKFTIGYIKLKEAILFRCLIKGFFQYL